MLTLNVKSNVEKPPRGDAGRWVAKPLKSMQPTNKRKNRWRAEACSKNF